MRLVLPNLLYTGSWPFCCCCCRSWCRVVFL